MQSRLVALLVGLFLCCAVGIGGPLLVESSRRLSLENQIERERHTYDLAAGIETSNQPTLKQRFDQAVDSDNNAAIFDGESIVVEGEDEMIVSNKQAERRIEEATQPLAADELIFPWTDGVFLTTSEIPNDRQRYQLVVLDRTDPIQSQVARLWTTYIAILVTAIILLTAMCYPLARWAMRPVKNLRQYAVKISNGEITTRAPLTSGAHDLRELTESFNNIADKLSASVQREQLFVASASHHFGNLLTPLRIRVESMDRQNVMVQETLAELDRLEMVAERLVQLSQAEEGQLAPIVLDIVPIVEQTLQSWYPVADFSRITIHSKIPDSANALVVPGALEEILDNLMDNAVKYGNESPITVRVVRGLSNIRLSVADHGPGLPDDQIEKAYGRFWRGTEHQNQQGSGLGLAIVQALALRCEAQFSMRNIPGGGLETSLALRRVDQTRRVPPPNVS